MLFFNRRVNSHLHFWLAQLVPNEKHQSIINAACVVVYLNVRVQPACWVIIDVTAPSLKVESTFPQQRRRGCLSSRPLTTTPSSLTSGFVIQWISWKTYLQLCDASIIFGLMHFVWLWEQCRRNTDDVLNSGTIWMLGNNPFGVSTSPLHNN